MAAATQRYELGIDAAKLDAIDMHVHVEVDGLGHGALPPALTEASAKYFKSEGRTPSLDRIADIYRGLNLAAVVFTVDARTQLKHEPNSIPALIAGAARNNDVLIPFDSVDPRTGAEVIGGAEHQAIDLDARGFKFHPSLQGFDPSNEQFYRSGPPCRNSGCQRFSTAVRTAWAPDFRTATGSSSDTPTRCCWTQSPRTSLSFKSSRPTPQCRGRTRPTTLPRTKPTS